MSSQSFHELVTLAKSALSKRAIVDAAALAGGGGGVEGGMDPAAAGMDPAMAGMDPSMMGGAPSAGGGGGDPALEARLAALEQQLAAGGGGAGGAAGGVEPVKPKIDVNVEILRMSKMIARIADAMGVHIPAHEMIATQNDLTQAAMQSQNEPMGAGAGGSAIQPVAPMDGASPAMAMGGGGGGEAGKTAAHVVGTAYNAGAAADQLASKAAALAALMSARKQV